VVLVFFVLLCLMLIDWCQVENWCVWMEKFAKIRENWKIFDAIKRQFKWCLLENRKSSFSCDFTLAVCLSRYRCWKMICKSTIGDHVILCEKINSNNCVNWLIDNSLNLWKNIHNFRKLMENSNEQLRRKKKIDHRNYDWTNWWLLHRSCCDLLILIFAMRIGGLLVLSV